jgi:hypothetical protein
VHHLVALSLLVFAVAVVVGLVLAGVRALAAWRAFKSFKRTASDAMLETAVRLELLEARSGASVERAARIEAAQASLQQALAEAAVIAEAAGEVRSFVERARLVIPSS